MSDENALLAAIWEHPHEDTPRLAYADWLQENARPERAEFIRAQVALATYAHGDPQARAFDERQKRLHRKHSRVWRQGAPPRVKRAAFHRGFLYPRVTARAQQLAAIPAADWDAAPLWCLRLNCGRAAVPDVLACPGLVRVGSLDFAVFHSTTRITHPDVVVRLVRAPELRNVDDLCLAFNHFGPEVVHALNEPGALPALADLSLSGCRIGAEGVRALAASPRADRLVRLHLSSNGLTAEELQPLFEALPRFVRLRELFIGWNTRPDEVARSAPAHALPPALESLDVGGGDLTHDGVAALAAWPQAAQLKSLDVGRYPGGHGPATVRALVESPYLGGLWKLTCPVGPEDNHALIAALRARFENVLRD